MRDSKNQLKMDKTFIISKVKEDDSEVIKLIKEGFEDPHNYFKVNSNIIIGKNTRGPRLDKDKNLIPYSVIGNSNIFILPKKINKASGFKNFINKAIHSTSSSGSANKKESQRPYEYIEDKKLIEIYKNISKDLETNNNNQKFNEFLNEVPMSIKKLLNIQESTLHTKSKSFDLKKNISMYLSKKSKKDEDDLLLNKQDQYRVKKEFEELVLNQGINSFENKVPLQNWMMTLRQRKENNIPSTSYIYYGDKYNPLWIPVREKKNKAVDIIRDPLSKTKTEFPSLIKNINSFENNHNENSYNTTMFNSFNNFSFMHSIGSSKTFSPCNSITNFSNNLSSKDLIVNGRSLLQSEKDVANQMSGRKILYRKDYLDSHIYGLNPSSNPQENEKNLMNLTKAIDIHSSYSSPFVNKGSTVKIKIIK